MPNDRGSGVSEFVFTWSLIVMPQQEVMLKKKLLKQTNYCWNVFINFVYSYTTKNSVSLILTNNAYKITMFYNIPTHIIENDGLII